MWNCDGSWVDLDWDPRGIDKVKKHGVDAVDAVRYMLPYCGRSNGKTLTQSELLFKSLTQEDCKQMAAMEKAIENARKAIERDWIRQPVNKFFDIKSIEVSVDHRTVVVVWADGETTKVVRSENDPDDIYMAFTAALAKKLYGSNSAIKRAISKKMNQHKPKIKKEEN